MSSEIQKELGSSICTVIFVKVDILRESQDGKIVWLLYVWWPVSLGL